MADQEYEDHTERPASTSVANSRDIDAKIAAKEAWIDLYEAYVYEAVKASSQDIYAKIAATEASIAKLEAEKAGTQDIDAIIAAKEAWIDLREAAKARSQDIQARIAAAKARIEAAETQAKITAEEATMKRPVSPRPMTVQEYKEYKARNKRDGGPARE